MDPVFAETLQMLIGIGGMTIVAVTALRVWVRRKELDYRADPQVDDSLESLRAEIDDLRAEHVQQMADLQERMDFTERLLSKGPDAG